MHLVLLASIIVYDLVSGPFLAQRRHNCAFPFGRNLTVEAFSTALHRHTPVLVVRMQGTYPQGQYILSGLPGEVRGAGA